jgi:hypothetical protein
VQVGRLQGGAERQAGADEPAVDLHLVAADEQPQVRHADRLQRGRPEQRAVEQRGDAREQLAVRTVRGEQGGPGGVPGQAAADGEGEPVRVVEVADGGGDGGQPAPLGQVQQGAQHALVGGAAVVVGQPHPVGAQREGVQDPQGEPPGAAEVAPRRQVRGRDAARLDDVPGRPVRPVVDHDEVVDGPLLLREDVERAAQQPGPVPRDDDGDDGAGGQRPDGSKVAFLLPSCSKATLLRSGAGRRRGERARHRFWSSPMTSWPL